MSDRAAVPKSPSRHSERRRTINEAFRFEPELLAELHATAAAEGLSRGEIVRAGVRRQLALMKDGQV